MTTIVETDASDKLIFKAYRNKSINLEEKLLNEVIRQYHDEKRAHYLLGTLKNQLNDYPMAIEYCKNAIKIDPQFKMAYNQLAYSYNAYGEFEKALWALDKYIEVAPNEANPHDTKTEIYAANGMLDNAIESYKRALTIKPDFYASLNSLALIYMFKNEFDRADSCLDFVISKTENGYQRTAYLFKCLIPQFQGKF